jgi:hypothetical protein
VKALYRFRMAGGGRRRVVEKQMKFPSFNNSPPWVRDACFAICRSCSLIGGLRHSTNESIGRERIWLRGDLGDLFLGIENIHARKMGNYADPEEVATACDDGWMIPSSNRQRDEVESTATRTRIHCPAAFGGRWGLCTTTDQVYVYSLFRTYLPTYIIGSFSTTLR